MQDGKSSGTAALPSKALATPAPKRSPQPRLRRGAEGSRANEHGNPLAGVQHGGGALQGERRARPATSHANARMRHSVLVRGLLHRHLLEIVRQDHDRHTPVGFGDSIGTINKMRHLCRDEGRLDVLRHVLEHALQIDVLL